MFVFKRLRVLVAVIPLLVLVSGSSIDASPTGAVRAPAFPGLGSNEVFQVQVGGKGGVPLDASAAALQLTVTGTGEAGYLTAYPCGSQQPNASVLNFQRGDTRTNISVVKLGTGGAVCVYSSAPVELIVDVVGFMDRSAPWVSINPARVTDTRRLPAGTATVAAGSITRVPVSAAPEVDDAATAAAINVTAVDAQAAGYLTVFPCDGAVPNASNVNFQPSVASANTVMTNLVAGQVCIYASATTNVIVDVMGWTTTAGAVSGVVPVRVTDTRLGQGGPRMPARSSRVVKVGLPSTPGAVAAINVTADRSGAGGYLTVHACGSAAPYTSNVNVTASGTSSGLALIAPDAAGNVCVYSYDATDLVVDLNGWLNPSSGYRPVTPMRIVDTRASTTVVSNYDPASYMSEGTPLPRFVGNDAAFEGAFRMQCNAGQLLYDDPIVFPGQPGASHLHQFFGNLAVNGKSTYSSLTSAGNSTCDGGPINRTGYWVPALIDAAKNQVIVPSTIIVYYKGEPKSNVQPLPEGLRMVAGYDLVGDRGRDAFSWQCESNGYASSSTIGSCGPGDLVAGMQFPECWDGINLDSADHRSHLAYAGYFGKSYPECPATHPVMIPRITYKVFYEIEAGESSASWRLSSDTHAGVTRPGGTTFHADWFGGWNTTFSNRWFRGCLIGLRDCNAGQPGSQLGDGGQLVNRAPSPLPARPPIPARP